MVSLQCFILLVHISTFVVSRLFCMKFSHILYQNHVNLFAAGCYVNIVTTGGASSFWSPLKSQTGIHSVLFPVSAPCIQSDKLVSPSHDQLLAQDNLKTVFLMLLIVCLYPYRNKDCSASKIKRQATTYQCRVALRTWRRAAWSSQSRWREWVIFGFTRTGSSKTRYFAHHEVDE